MNRIASLVLLAVCAFPASAMVKAQGDCAQGGYFVTSNGVQSSATFMRSFVNLTGGVPTSGCTVSVYQSGSTTLVTVFSDNAGTVLGNPFTADATGHWGFYAPNGTYDVVLYGAGITSPFTIAGVWLFDIAAYAPPVQGAAGFDQSVQLNVNGAFGADSGFQWNYNTHQMNVTGTISLTGNMSSTGYFTSSYGNYQAFASSVGGAVLPGYGVIQTGSNTGGYIDLAPVTYNPYGGSSCTDVYGNPVTQPSPLPGLNFATHHSILWVSTSPLMPSSGACGAPLPVDLNYGLNTNTYIFARGGFATDTSGFNSFTSFNGGMFLGLGLTANQGVYMRIHTSTSTLNTPSSVGYPDGTGTGQYTALAYQGGSKFWYYNSTTAQWATVDFSATGGGGGGAGNPAGPGNAIQYNNGGSFGGTNNAQVDASGNLSIAGTLQANGGAGTGVNVVVNTAYNSIQTVGGFRSNIGNVATVGLTIQAAASQTANLTEWYSSSPSLLASVDKNGAALFAGMTLSNITGSAQCLQVNTSGVVSGTGGVCGGSGSTPHQDGSVIANTFQIQFNNGGVFGSNLNLWWDNGHTTAGKNYLVVRSTDASSPAISAVTGYVQADQGFLATTATCLAFNCIQAPTGGFLGQNLNIAIHSGQTTGGYIAMQNLSSAPLQDTNDNWTSLPGIMYFTTLSTVPGWQFSVGTGANTIADTNVFAAGFRASGNAYNSVRAPVGGIYAGLGVTADQAMYIKKQSSPNPPDTNYGGIGYLGTPAGSTYQYWNGTAWAAFDFASGGGGGGGSVPGSFGDIMFNCTGASTWCAATNGGAIGTSGAGSPHFFTFDPANNTLAMTYNGSVGGEFFMSHSPSNTGILISGIQNALIQATNALNLGSGNQTTLTLNPAGGDVYVAGNVAANNTSGSVYIQPSGVGHGHVYISRYTDDTSGNQVQIGGAVSASGGYYTNNAQPNAIQAPSGGVTAAKIVATSGLYIYQSYPLPPPPPATGSGYGGLGFSNGSSYWFWNGTGAGSWGTVDFTQIPSSSSNLTINSLTTAQVIQSAYTGTGIAFQTGAGTGLNPFQVAGNGTVSMQNLNVNNVSTTNFSVSGSTGNIASNGGGTFNSGVTFNGGIATGSGSNSSIYIGSSGNLYIRYVGVAHNNAGITCSGVADGWMAISSDQYLVMCQGNAKYSVAMNLTIP
jgi:hypothetical protein